VSVTREREARAPGGGRDAEAARWHVTHGAHLAACLALLAARGRQAVVQRDAGAVLDALIVSGLVPHWLAPAGVADALRVTPAGLDAALTAAPGARAALVASGEPDAAVADVEALVEVAHGHGAALVIDAAGPQAAGTAVAGGADLVIAAGLGAPTDATAAGRARDVDALDAAKRFTRRRAGAALLHGPDAERWLPATAIERAVTLAGGRAAAPLMPFPRSVPSPGARPVDTAEPRRFARTVPRIQPGPTVCSPRAAWLAPQERVTPADAVGRIAAEALTPAVPGVPAVLPGERLVPDVVATLRAVVDAGGTVHGAVDDLATLAVVAEPRR
jgi:hypothetical protein